MQCITMVPAYGKDYKSKKEVQEAFDAGSDFRIQDCSCPYDGKLCSKRDLKPGDEARIRYKKLTQVVILKVK